MLRAIVVVKFCRDASVRRSLIELLPGQRTVSLYSSTEVWVRILNLRRLSENRTSRRTCCNSEEPDEYRNRTHQQNLPRPLILMEQLLLLLLLFLTFSALVANPKKTTLHGGQSRSWSAEQGKKEEKKSLAAHPPPPPRALLVRRKNKKLENHAAHPHV